MGAGSKLFGNGVGNKSYGNRKGHYGTKRKCQEFIIGNSMLKITRVWNSQCCFKNKKLATK